MLEISSDATGPLRCHGCVHSNDDGGSAEHVAVLKMRHFAVPETRPDATEPRRCRDCSRSDDYDRSVILSCCWSLSVLEKISRVEFALVAVICRFNSYATGSLRAGEQFQELSLLLLR